MEVIPTVAMKLELGMPGISIRSTIRRLIPRVALATAAVSGLVVGVAPQAHAASQLVCNGGGGITIDKQIDGTYRWAMSGAATCENPDGSPRGVTLASLTGLAQTDGLGFCSGASALSAFSMNVAITFSVVTPIGSISRVEHQVWSFPATAFPIITAYTVNAEGSGSTLGTGAIATHIFGRCPPLGEPSMQVGWVQSS